MKTAKVILLLCIICLFTGCENKQDGKDIKYSVAVVETSGSEEKSLLSFYDENLELVNVREYKYACLGTHFFDDTYVNGSVYFVPNGLMKRHDAKKVVSFDLKNGNATNYKIDRVHLQCVTANDRYVFASSNLNLDSYITRLDKKTGDVKELAQTKSTYDSLHIIDNKLIATENGDKDGKVITSLHVIDIESMDTIKKIDISKYGASQTKMCLQNGILYFSNSHNKEDEDENTICAMNLKDYSIKEIELEGNTPNDILPIGNDELLISCSHSVTCAGTKVIKYNTKNGKQKVYDLKMPIQKIVNNEDTLFVLTPDDQLASYDLKNDLKLIKKVKLQQKSVYFSTIFVQNPLK